VKWNGMVLSATATRRTACILSSAADSNYSRRAARVNDVGGVRTVQPPHSHKNE
jgi:hypothetical protein